MDKAKLMYEMTKKNISIQEMTKQLRLSRSAFFRKRNGMTEFTESELIKMADIFQCSVDYLLGRCA